MQTQQISLVVQACRWINYSNEPDWNENWRLISSNYKFKNDMNNTNNATDNNELQELQTRLESRQATHEDQMISSTQQNSNL